MPSSVLFLYFRPVAALFPSCYFPARCTNMDKHGAEWSREFDDSLGESASSPSEELTEPSPIVGCKGGCRKSVKPREFVAPMTAASRNIICDFLNRKYGELDSRQADENKQRNFSYRQFLRAALFLAGREGNPCAKFARHTMSSKFRPKSHKTNDQVPHKVTHKTKGACMRLRDWDITAPGRRKTKRQLPAGRHNTAEVSRESLGGLSDENMLFGTTGVVCRNDCARIARAG
jgi:hypothetical protein